MHSSNYYPISAHCSLLRVRSTVVLPRKSCQTGCLISKCVLNASRSTPITTADVSDPPRRYSTWPSWCQRPAALQPSRRVRSPSPTPENTLQYLRILIPHGFRDDGSLALGTVCSEFTARTNWFRRDPTRPPRSARSQAGYCTDDPRRKRGWRWTTQSAALQRKLIQELISAEALKSNKFGQQF